MCCTAGLWNFPCIRASLMAQQKRTRLPMREMQEMQVQFLGGQDLLEKEMALSNNNFLCNCNFMCLVIQSWLTLCDPMDYGLPVSFCPRNFPGKNTGRGCLLQTVTSYHWTMSPLTSFPPSSGDHHSTVSSILLPILYSLKIKCL